MIACASIELLYDAFSLGGRKGGKAAPDILDPVLSLIVNEGGTLDVL